MINIMHLTKKPIALAVTAVILVSSSMSVFAATLSAEPSEVDNATVENAAITRYDSIGDGIYERCWCRFFKST